MFRVFYITTRQRRFRQVATVTTNMGIVYLRGWRRQLATDLQKDVSEVQVMLVDESNTVVNFTSDYSRAQFARFPDLYEKETEKMKKDGFNVETYEVWVEKFPLLRTATQQFAST